MNNPSNPNPKRHGHKVPKPNVSAKLVSETDRPIFIPTHFGPNGKLIGEKAAYQYMYALCPSYKGGMWDYYELSNGSFYLAPRSSGDFDLNMPLNGFNGRVSADAAGIIVTAMVLNELVMHGHGALSRALYRLIDFARAHAECAVILAALD